MSQFTVYFLAYYVTIGFLGLLLWAGVGSTLIEPLHGSRRTRVRSIGAALLLVGIAHPMFAFAGRDVLRDLQRADRVDDPHTPRADVLVIISSVIAVVVLFAVLR